MGYFEDKQQLKYIHSSKKTIEERLYLLERKVDIIIKKLNKSK